MSKLNWADADWDALKAKYDDLLRLPHFVGLDLETTGFSPQRHAEIIELSAIRLDHKSQKHFHKFETLVRPTTRIPAKITKLTGITNEDVKTARGFTHIAKELYTFISDGVLVAHNASFEQRFMDYYLNYNQLFYTNPYFDTMAAMKLLFPKAKSYKLDAFLDLFDLTNPDWHSAMSDSLMTLVGFEKLREKYLAHYHLPDQIDYDFEDVNFEPEIWTPLSANYWEKAYHTKNPRSRLYVRVKAPNYDMVANIYYDYIIDDWNYNNALTKVPLDFSEITNELCQRYHVKNLKDFNPHYNKDYQAIF